MMFWSRKKKVGYLAWLGVNYGSTLQAFALYKTICLLGYDCEIIGHSSFTAVPALKKEIRNTDPKRYDWIKSKALFVSFMKSHFKFSSSSADLPGNCLISPKMKDRLKKYDAFVCGSDQIWKPAGFWFYPVQYLQFAPPEKRVSYAPSVGWKTIPKAWNSNIPLWEYWLRSVPYLSSREHAGSMLIEKLTGRHVYTVVDPSLLLTPDQWLCCMKKPVYSPEISSILKSGRSYLLAYLLDSFEIYRDYVTRLAESLNLEIVWLAGRDRSGAVQVNISETDPAGFVSLVANASFVCADGFHGCCFSVNFSRNFLYLSPMDDFETSNDSRLHDLFSRFGISGRVVTPSTQSNFDFPDIDYQEVQKKVAEERASSVSYLSGALCGTAGRKGEMYQEICGYGDLIDSRPVNILRPKPLLKNYTPVFEFRKDVWECSSTGESQILVPKESSKKGRRFAYAPLGFVFSFGIPYRFAVRLKCRTDESMIYIHLYSPEEKTLQVIHKIKTGGSAGNKWITADFTFIPNGKSYSSLMFAASQITGENRRIEISSLDLEVLTDVSALN